MLTTLSIGMFVHCWLLKTAKGGVSCKSTSELMSSWEMGIRVNELLGNRDGVKELFGD